MLPSQYAGLIAISASATNSPLRVESLKLLIGLDRGSVLLSLMCASMAPAWFALGYCRWLPLAAPSDRTFDNPGSPQSPDIDQNPCGPITGLV